MIGFENLIKYVEQEFKEDPSGFIVAGGEDTVGFISETPAPPTEDQLKIEQLEKELNELKQLIKSRF